MTREEILQMAKEAGVVVVRDSKFGREEYFNISSSMPAFERFANMVAAREREKCAVIAWTVGMDLHMKQYDAREIGSTCARAIRERNN